MVDWRLLRELSARRFPGFDGSRVPRFTSSMQVSASDRRISRSCESIAQIPQLWCLLSGVSVVEPQRKNVRFVWTLLASLRT